MSVTITITHAAKTKPKKPELYQVLLLNDDYTPMEFVVHILKRFFSKSEEDAQKIMQIIHTRGEGACGSYPHDIAKTKATQVVDFARANDYPLQCVVRAQNV